MPQEILDTVQRYIESHAGYKVNPDAKKRMEANARPFKHLLTEKQYSMKVEITEDRACNIQFFAPAGNLYITYVFGSIVIPE